MLYLLFNRTELNSNKPYPYYNTLELRFNRPHLHCTRLLVKLMTLNPYRFRNNGKLKLLFSACNLASRKVPDRY